MIPADLPGTWRDEAARLRSRYARDDLAALAEAHAAELEAALREAEDALLPPAVAAKESLSERSLRARRAAGHLKNHGTEARPLYRRGDLPRRANRDHSNGFDASAHVREILR